MDMVIELGIIHLMDIIDFMKLDFMDIPIFVSGPDILIMPDFIIADFSDMDIVDIFISIPESLDDMRIMSDFVFMLADSGPDIMDMPDIIMEPRRILMDMLEPDVLLFDSAELFQEDMLGLMSLSELDGDMERWSLSWL